MKKPVKTKRSPGAILCGVYLCLLCVALPLTVHDVYYDITRTKAVVFWLLSGALLLGAVIWLCSDKTARASLGQPDAAEGLFFLFVLTHLLSTLLFRPFSVSLLAPDNRYQGIVSFLFYAASFAILRRYARWDPLVGFALLLGSTVAGGLAVAEVFGADLLGLRAVSPEIELPRFFSTVGNIAFHSALCVLLLPYCAYRAISAPSPRSALPFALCALLFLCCGIAMRTETFVLGALAFFSLLPLFTREARVLRRVPLLWAAGALAALLFALAMRRWGLYRLSELSALLCSPVLLLPISFLALGLWLLLRRKEDLFICKLQKVYIILFLVFLAALAVFLILANTLWAERLPGTLGAVAVFSPSWGSDRGAEWISFWQMFRQASPLQKLIGCGSGSLADWDRANRLFADAVTDSAHNEYLHYLLTGGILGLGGYLAVLVLAIRSVWTKPSHLRSALALGVYCYAVQALVNLAQPFTTPLFFAILALLCSEHALDKRETNEETSFLWVALAVLAVVLLVAAAAMAK